MNLPNYFLADLPEDARITASLIAEACRTLKDNRAHYLANRSTMDLIRLIADLAAEWPNPQYPFRRLAVEEGAKQLRFSQATIGHGLDSFFKEVTVENLEQLCAQDFGHAQRLDEPQTGMPEKKTNRSSICRGPVLLAQVTGGLIPNPTISQIITGLLLRSAQFVKCATGTSLIPRLFAHSLYEANPKLGACVEIASWSGTQAELNRALFVEADCVTATGSDETLKAIRAQVPGDTRFVGYGHRLSFGFVARSALAGFGAKRLAHDAAVDVAAWDQVGCLSPHVFYIENGGRTSPVEFATLLAGELEALEGLQPRGSAPVEAHAAISTRRSFYEVRTAAGMEARQWRSEASTAWTVVYEADARFQHSCLHRFIYVKPVGSLREALEASDAVTGKVSTVGLASGEEDAARLVVELADWGVTRVCPLGRMQSPTLLWRHDGRPTLGDLVRWTDWEH